MIEVDYVLVASLVYAFVFCLAIYTVANALARGIVLWYDRWRRKN